MTVPSKSVSLWDQIVNYVRDQLNTLWSNTVNFVNGQIESVKTYLKAWVVTLGYEAGTVLRNVITAAVQAVYNFIGYNNKEGISLFNYIINWGVNKIQEAYNSLQNLITAKEQSTITLFSPLLVFLDWLKSTAPVITPDFLVKMRDLVTRIYASLITFFKDPGGFILSLIWSKALLYIEYVLGYAMGVTEGQLPVIPQWYDPNGGEGGITPAPLGPPMEGIVYPCTPLYISGTIFSPAHPATDFGIIDGQDIYAAHAGYVEVAEWSNIGYGFNITVRGNPYWTRYAHLKQILVMPGQYVSAGEKIAYGDSTGNSTGPHLHFEVKVNGAFRDPMTVL